MKLLSTLLILGAAIGNAADQAPNSYVSLKQEIRQAIARGNTWLKNQQKPAGNWDDDGIPAISALALTAASRDPNLDRKAPFPEHMEKGFTWLLAQQKEDGGIYNRGLSVYNTATAVTALVAAGREGYEPSIVRARKHLIDLPGLSAPRVMAAVRSVMVPDTYGPALDLMEAPDGELPVQRELVAAAQLGGAEFRFVERFAFYDLAAQAELIIRTGETRVYGNGLFRKGVTPVSNV